MPSNELAALEARIAALESLLGVNGSEPEGLDLSGAELRRSKAGSIPGTYAILEKLEESSPGSVAVVGSVETDAGPVRWQYALPHETLVERDWSEASERLAALGNSARLQVLHAVLGGPRRVSELVDELGFDSLGQLNHHVRVLTSAGWVQSAGRGVIQVPPARVVPLLAVLVALN